MHVHIRWRVACGLMPLLALSSAVIAQNSDPLTLREALALALVQSPALEAYAFDVRAAESRALQAGLRPNPELEFEIENIRFSGGGDTTTRAFDAGGMLQDREVEDGPGAGLDNAEFSLSLSQLIELGGKRAKRIAAGEQEIAASTWDFEVARVNLLAHVAERFVLALAAQVNAALAEDSLNLAEEVHGAISARVEAGAASPIEASRAQLETSTAIVEVEQARRGVLSAYSALAAAIGLDKISFTEVAGDMAIAPETLRWDVLEEAAVESPEIRRWLAEIALCESRLDLERAQRWPDLTITGGWRTSNLDTAGSRTFDNTGTLTGFGRTSPEDDRAHSFLLSFSLPVPLFDRNQGSVREAEHLVSKAEAETRAAEVHLESALFQAWQAQAAAAVRVEQLQESIVPQAEQIFASTNEGYREGKLDYLSVLDAQRTLFESRAQLAAARTELHIATIALDRLAGSIDESIQNSEE